MARRPATTSRSAPRYDRGPEMGGIPPDLAGFPPGPSHCKSGFGRGAALHAASGGREAGPGEEEALEQREAQRQAYARPLPGLQLLGEQPGRPHQNEPSQAAPSVVNSGAAAGSCRLHADKRTSRATRRGRRGTGLPWGKGPRGSPGLGLVPHRRPAVIPPRAAPVLASRRVSVRLHGWHARCLSPIEWQARPPQDFRYGMRGEGHERCNIAFRPFMAWHAAHAR